jgi:hypothetical protein
MNTSIAATGGQRDSPMDIAAMLGGCGNAVVIRSG